VGRDKGGGREEVLTIESKTDRRETAFHEWKGDPVEGGKKRKRKVGVRFGGERGIEEGGTGRGSKTHTTCKRGEGGDICRTR